MLQLKSNKHYISKTTLKKAVAFFSAFCICTASLEEWNLTNSHKVFADTAPTSLIVDKERTLTYAGGRSYTMTLDAAAYLTKRYASESTSEDGCYVAPFDGNYLVQLWGGNGGNGGILDLLDNGNPGGEGGYVYGIVNLKKDDVLLYNIGTTGQISMFEETGGGANGDGGAHGDEGIYIVGGGGGYSAVYKYSANEYHNETRPTEADRMQKVILIAGGGGGGGANNEAGISDFPTGKPKGGAGGTIGSSASGAVDGGTFYAGANGSSSGAVGGSSTAYVGIGGTNKPGPAVYTNGGSHCSEGGNDWYCITDPNRIGGAGGMGNLRGGGGGAGFCGGSGGIVQALLKGRNVGGGGGGSSFVASTVSTDIEDLSENEKVSYMISSNPNKTKGGYCNIVYLPDTEMNFGDYSDVTIGFPVSDYFKVTVTGGTWDVDNKQITGVNIAPDEYGVEDNHAKITVTFTAKDTFAGGNNVPLLTGPITMVAADAARTDIPDFETNPDLDNVNVPLKYELTTHSIWLNSGETPEAKQLYDEMAKGIDETFIAYRTDYKDYKIDPELALLTENQKKQEYTISYTVTPNTDSYAKIGPQQGVLDVSGKATVNIKQEGATYIPDAANQDKTQDQLDASTSDVVLTTSRTLVFNGKTNTYDTQITISAETGTKGVPRKMLNKNELDSTHVNSPANGATISLNTIPSDTGWYLVEAWGANGGDGGGLGTAAGGTGGTGGYVYGFVNIKDISSITASFSPQPTDFWSNGDSSLGWQTGGSGKGGSATTVKFGETALLIAGGGGGGSRAYHGSLSGYVAGKDGGKRTDIESTFNNGEDYYNGEHSEVKDYMAAGAADGGAAGHNYRASSVSSSLSDIATPSNANPNGKNGCVRITPIKVVSTSNPDPDDVGTDAKALLSSLKFSLDGEWSTYIVEENAGESTLAKIQSDGLNLGNINAKLKDNGTAWEASGDVSFTLKGKPIEGFLGGNDVPMFPMTDNDKNGGLTLQCTKGSDTYTMAMDNGASLNYVNVAIPQKPEFTLQDAEKIYGVHVSIPDLLMKSDYSLPMDQYLADFVKLEQSVTPSDNADPNNSTATQTQEYTITETLSPNEDAKKATVIPLVSSVSYSQSATLNVVYSVDTTGLENITCDAGDTTPMGEDFSTTLTPADGYKLPASITVTINGTDANPVSHYRYDSQTGELFIPQEYMGNLEITAVGVVQTYDLVFRVSSNKDNTAFTEHKFSYPAGTTLAGKEWSTWLNGLTIPSIDGYDFKWDLVNDDKTLKGADGKLMTTMPANNWFAFGTYFKKEYTLTIHYQDELGNELADDYTQNFYLGDTYSIPSPSVSGYVPDQPVVSGTISDNVTVVVKYTHVTGQLVIVYVYEDGSTASETYSEKMNTGDTYTVLSPSVTGYTADKTSVSGTMTDNGVYEIVTYHPNEITLTFNAGEGATVSPTERKAYFGKAFGYVKDGDEYTFEALPTPVKTGCKFLGWCIGTNTQTIDEETKCELTEATTLTAKWEADTVTLKIYYLFEDGTTAAEADIVKELVVNSPYGDLYEKANSKTVANKECYTMKLGGNEITSDTEVPIGTTDKAIYVTFVAKEYTLTVNYYDENGKPVNYYDEDGKLDTLTQSYTVKYGQAYSEAAIKPTDVDSTTYAGYTASPDIIEGVMDANGKTVNVTFVDGGAPITVTVSWSSLNFTASTIAWDTTDHVYYATAFTNDSTSDDHGTITITNDSPRTAITADMSYESKFGFESVGCEFSANSVVVEAKGEKTIPPSKSVNVKPSGKMRCDTSGSYTVGTCKVKLSAGGQTSAP